MRASQNDYPWELTPNFLKQDQSKLWFDLLEESVEWSRPKVKVFGKEHFVPRQTCFIACKGISYRYSGIVHYGQGWPSWFVPILDRVSSYTGVAFNGCLLNLYRNGSDRMGWHADDEVELDHTKPIASLSLGSNRDFHFKKRLDNDRKNINLRSGDLLIMNPPCQRIWQHCLPIRRKVKEPRINLTFRVYKEV